MAGFLRILGLKRMKGWLGQRVKDDGMFWSGLGVKRTCEVLEEAGFDVIARDLVKEPEKAGEKEEVIFLWIIAKVNATMG